MLMTQTSPTGLPPDEDLLARGRMARSLWLAAGLVLVGIGFVGLFVPLLPTADFLILALPCFARSSPRLEAWLLGHPRFGPMLRAWRASGAVPRHAKVASSLGMALGLGLFAGLAHPRWPWVAGVAALMLAAAVWIWRRPEP